MPSGFWVPDLRSGQQMRSGKLQQGTAFDSRWVPPPVGGAPSRRTGTGGATTGLLSPVPEATQVLGTRESGSIPTSSPSQIRKNRWGGGVPPPAPPPTAPLRGADEKPIRGLCGRRGGSERNRSLQSTNSKQLGSQPRRCRAEQAAGQVASRGDARAGQRARTGGAKKPRRDLRGQRLRIRQLCLTVDLLGDRRENRYTLFWQIYESLSLRDKRTSTTAEPLELA
jgi:hypothetical protein